MSQSKSKMGPKQKSSSSKSQQEQSISDSFKDLQLKNGKRKKGSKSQKPHFFDLPELAIENILKFLEVKSLRTLRQVSKWTKALVEHPSHIIKFQIQIPSRKCLIQIVKSEVHWNNFYFSNWKSFVKPEVLERYLEPFFLKFGPVVKIFKSDLFLTHSVVSQIVKFSKDLQVLDIADAFFQSTSNLSQEELEINLENLSTLKIYGGSHLKYILESESGLPKLKYLRIYETRNGSDWQVTSDSDSFISTVDSIKKFLKKRSQNKTTPGYKITPLTIDFGGLEGFERLWHHSYNFGISPKDLIELCELCNLIPGTIIQNVDSVALPKYADVIRDKNLQKKMKCIKSVIVQSRSMREDYIPPECDIYYQEGVKDQDYANYYLPPDQIKSLTLMKDCWAPMFYNDPLNFHLLLDNIFHSRPALEELTIFRQTQSCVGPVREDIDLRLDFNYFPNLRRLYMDLNCLSKEQFWTACEHLKMLEEMYIGMYSVSDEYLIGTNEEAPAFLKLSRLKSLNLKYGNPELTDVSLIKLFSRMTLHKLKLDCRIVTHQITFDGLTRLLSGTSFGKSIKSLEMQKPIDCTMGQCSILVRQNCKAMKYFRFNNEQEKQRSKVQCEFKYYEG